MFVLIEESPLFNISRLINVANVDYWDRDEVSITAFVDNERVPIYNHNDENQVNAVWARITSSIVRGTRSVTIKPDGAVKIIQPD